MASVVIYGFPGSTYVQIVRLVLSHKVVEFKFQDLEPDMNTPADLFMVPCMTSLARTEEGRVMLGRHPLVTSWRERMEQLESVQRFRAAQPARKAIEHARRWVTTHRPGLLA